MNTQITNLSLNEPEDDSCVSTPTASIQLPRPHRPNEPQPLIDHHRDQQPSSDHAGAFAASLAAMLDESLNLSQNPEPSRPQKSPSPPESNNTQLILPLPVVPSNKSQTSASHPDATHEEFLVRIADLPPEVTSADISVAPDGSFVETSSGAAAREIKRRYDQYLGVGKDVQNRSPFAITAFVNQHGRQMYRVGHRQLSAPAASAAAAAEDIDRTSTRAKSVAVASVTHQALHPPYSTQTKRRSRMSVHSFLPPTMFNKSPALPAQLPKEVPYTGQEQTTRSSPPTRKLRKTRSIPNMNRTEVVGANVPAPKPTAHAGRPHAHSVSSADAYRVSIPPPPPPPLPPPPPQHDIFSEIMAWNSVPPSPFSSRSTSYRPFDSSSMTPPDFIVHPFGAGVTFDIPVWSSPSHLTSPPALREMQSFDSVLTARGPPAYGKLKHRLSDLSDDGGDAVEGQQQEQQQQQQQESSTPPSIEVDVAAGVASPISPDPETPIFRPAPPAPPVVTVHEANEPSMVSKYSTSLFDVLQNFRGLPTGDKLDRLPANETIRLSLKSEETAAPRDDPRFVIWGEIEGDDYQQFDEYYGGGGGGASKGSVTDLSSGHHSIVSRRKSGKRHTVSVADLSPPPPPPPLPHLPPSVRVSRISSGEGPKKVLVAATIERWIAQLTSELNYDELLIFFLTYRMYVSAEDLGHLLICRFHWALGQTTSGHDEMVRRIVRVRTFIAIRYWLLTFFSVDFVPNRELRVLFASWLNELLRDPVLERHKDALGIVRKLRKLVLDCKDAHTRKATGRNSTITTTTTASTAPRQSAEKISSIHPASSLSSSAGPVPGAGAGVGASSTTSTSSSAAASASANAKSNTYPTLGDLSNGHFAESLRRAVSKDQDDVDIDLDFDSSEATGDCIPLGLGDAGGLAVPGFGGATMVMESLDGGMNGGMGGVGVGAGGLNGSMKNQQQQQKKLTTTVDLAMLRHPLHLAFLQYGKQTPATPPPPPSNSGSVPLPVAHSTISRVIVNTMGRLGRWKRVLNSRTPVRAPIGTCVDISAFDVEGNGENESGDLLLVRGGVEQYLRLVESHMSQPDLTLGVGGVVSPPRPVPSPSPPRLHPVHPIPPAPLPQVSAPAPVVSHPVMMDPPVPAVTTPAAATPVRDDLASVVKETGLSVQEVEVLEQVQPHFQPIVTPSIQDVPDLSRASTALSSTSQSDFLASRASIDSKLNRRWQPDVVSIDDLDLSDMSSDESVELQRPLGLKKLARRLPNRRDFQFVRHSIDSVSSMGVRTHKSVLSASSSIVSGKSASAGPELGAAIQQWQVNALVDSLTDEEEDGDVEAALRRLEGQINQDKQRMKLSKVDGWVQSIRERLAAGQFGAERPRYSSGSDEEDYGVVKEGENGRDSVSVNGDSASRHSISRVSTRSSVSSVVSPQSTAPTAATAGTSTAPTSHAPSPPLPPATAPPRIAPVVPAVVEVKRPPKDDVVPVEILNSRLSMSTWASNGNSIMYHHPSMMVARPMTSSGLAHSSRFIADRLHRHQSFIKGCRSADLIQHFSMIDRELFLNLRFEELISRDWSSNAEEANILDWGKFLQERARLRMEGMGGSKTSALTVVRGRFNLMANFVVSEIVLTHPSERAALMGKFIRMAWKAYNMQSFNTLVAIIAGLKSEWVSKAMRQHHVKGLGMWETRVLNDLVVWTTPEGDFKHIRRTVDALAEAKPAPTGPTDTSSTDGHSSTTRNRAASEGKPPLPAMCIPFFGVYLSCLHRYSSLPDLIDPTAPNEPVAINPLTNSFEAPAHPEVFSALAPLPPSVQLEPLINVHKQRLTAAVVKSLVAGQHLAARVQYPIQRKLFQLCLKLRGLDPDTLNRALALYQHES